MQVPTTLRVEGDESPLSAGLGLAAYRIVQEALTNIRRHAHARTAEVYLRYGEDCLEIEVVDDGVGAVAAEGGNGLIGMRERVQA
jgi:signal transduction histidine kinase